jgi:hypothetical protein
MIPLSDGKCGACNLILGDCNCLFPGNCKQCYHSPRNCKCTFECPFRKLNNDNKKWTKFSMKEMIQAISENGLGPDCSWDSPRRAMIKITNVAIQYLMYAKFINTRDFAQQKS